MSKLYGKYRAKVLKIKDPEKRGRIKVMCPKVYGDYESPWCLPCVPFALDDGGFYKVPSIDEMVWIEFEEGDSNYPILVGGLWQESNSPLNSKVYDEEIDKHLILKTEGHTIDISDKDGESYIEITDKAGSSIKFDSESGDIIIKAVNNLTTIAGNIHRSNGSQVHHN